MNRKVSIDILRIMGAFAVVAVHLLNAPIAAYKGELPQAVIWNMKSAEILLGWVVPIFMMITGYCILNKKECTYKYCFAHVKKYIIVLFTVGLFFSLLEKVFNAYSAGLPVFSLKMLGEALLAVINCRLWDHMWFVYAIIGIYLVMPVIHKFMQSDEKSIYIFVTLLFIFNILVPELNRKLSLTIDFGFPFTGYLFYVCFGGMVRKCKISKLFFYTVLVCGVISAIYMVNNHTEIGRYNDKSPYVCVFAMAVFLAVNKINFKGSKLTKELAACTWGMYLIHPIFLNIGLKIFNIDLLTTLPYLKITAATVVIFLLSFGFTWIMRRLPLLKEIF